MFPTVDNFQRWVCPQELSFGMIYLQESVSLMLVMGQQTEPILHRFPAGSGLSPALYPERNGAVFGTEC